MKVIIDRFEGEYALVELENGEVINVNKKLFPNAVSGDVIKIDVLNEETHSRKKFIENLVNNTFED